MEAMRFQPFEDAIAGAYVALILGIGAYFSREGSADLDEYFLGGKSLPWCK